MGLTIFIYLTNPLYLMFTDLFHDLFTFNNFTNMKTSIFQPNFEIQWFSNLYCLIQVMTNTPSSNWQCLNKVLNKLSKTCSSASQDLDIDICPENGGLSFVLKMEVRCLELPSEMNLFGSENCKKKMPFPRLSIEKIHLSTIIFACPKLPIQELLKWLLINVVGNKIFR